MLIEQP
jgi:hypothetical protein